MGGLVFFFFFLFLLCFLLGEIVKKKNKIACSPVYFPSLPLSLSGSPKKKVPCDVGAARSREDDTTSGILRERQKYKKKIYEILTKNHSVCVCVCAGGCCAQGKKKV